MPSGTFGNEQRNRLTGPGFQNFDMTFQRLLRLGPRLAATLRWDIFNVFNTVNFGIPNKDISTRRDVRDDLEPGERSAHDADRDSVRVLITNGFRVQGFKVQGSFGVLGSGSSEPEPEPRTLNSEPGTNLEPGTLNPEPDPDLVPGSD